MRLFHLSYDNGKMDAEEVARVLRDKLNVSEIGRPVESTMVFKMTPSLDDVDRIAKALKQKFTADDACFVVSRVVYVRHGENDSRDHIRVKAGKVDKAAKIRVIGIGTLGTGQRLERIRAAQAVKAAWAGKSLLSILKPLRVFIRIIAERQAQEVQERRGQIHR